MTPAALEAFLALPLIASLATSIGDEPRVLPMWFRWDGTSIWMETSPTFPNYEVLRRNPKAALAIDQSLGGLQVRAVIMRGHVEIIEGSDDIVHDGVRRIYERYLDPDAMRGAGKEMMTNARHVLLRFQPTMTISWDLVTDADQPSAAAAAG